VDIINNQSVTSVVRMRRYKEEPRHQLAFYVTLSVINQLTTIVRMHRYKEERRRQLVFHMDIIHNQSVNLYCAHAQVQGGAEVLPCHPCGHYQ
jgi:hypothetical protein